MKDCNEEYMGVNKGEDRMILHLNTLLIPLTLARIPCSNLCKSDCFDSVVCRWTQDSCVPSLIVEGCLPNYPVDADELCCDHDDPNRHQCCHYKADRESDPWILCE